ncbi:MAG: SURF1 family protein [Acidimicrobiia bacterium]
MTDRKPITGGWIGLGLFVAAFTVVSLLLALWQYDRGVEVAERNEVLARRLASDPVPLDALLLPDVEQADEDLIGWPVEVTGRFMGDQQVLIRGRANDGTPGAWLVAPLERSDGSLVAVNRGWVPLEIDSPDDPRVVPPAGQVTVAGITIPDEEPTRIGPQDPPEGELDVLANLDLDRIGAQLGTDLGPVVIQAVGEASSPPLPLDLPDPTDAGPHTAYVIQWIGFAIVAVVGFAALVGRQLGRGPLARLARRPTVPERREKTDVPVDR